MPTKKKIALEEFQYNIAFGEGTAARTGMVMLRITRAGRILVEEHMPPEEFLNLALSFENVARGVRNHLDGKPVG